MIALTTDNAQDFVANADASERELDRQFENHSTLMLRLDERLDRIVDWVRVVQSELYREDYVDRDSLLGIYDNFNALVAEALTEDLVESEGRVISFSEWDEVTSPAVAEDEIVLTASEYAREVDQALTYGFEDGFDSGYDKGLDQGLREGADAGIDIGIEIGARVIRVLGGRVHAATDLYPDAR